MFGGQFPAKPHSGKVETWSYITVGNMFPNVLIIGCSQNLEPHCSYNNRLSKLRRMVNKYDPIHV